MKYDLSELGERVSKLRRAFIIKAVILLGLMILALILALLNFNDHVTLISAISEIPLLLLFWFVYNKSEANVIFTGELLGENIKEYEYVVRKTNIGLKPTASRKVTMPNTFANRKPAHVNINGTIYVRLEDGNINELRALPKSLMDFYETGDILFKPAGVKYPIVTNRELKKQPCPYCGTVNSDNEERCTVCNLKIILN